MSAFLSFGQSVSKSANFSCCACANFSCFSYILLSSPRPRPAQSPTKRNIWFDLDSRSTHSAPLFADVTAYKLVACYYVAIASADSNWTCNNMSMSYQTKVQCFGNSGNSGSRQHVKHETDNAPSKRYIRLSASKVNDIWWKSKWKLNDCLQKLFRNKLNLQWLMILKYFTFL